LWPTELLIKGFSSFYFKCLEHLKVVSAYLSIPSRYYKSSQATPEHVYGSHSEEYGESQLKRLMLSWLELSAHQVFPGFQEMNSAGPSRGTSSGSDDA
jgi:hypothetical protein